MSDPAAGTLQLLTQLVRLGPAGTEPPTSGVNAVGLRDGEDRHLLTVDRHDPTLERFAHQRSPDGRSGGLRRPQSPADSAGSHDAPTGSGDDGAAPPLSHAPCT